MKFYLIRHGETTGDLEDRYGGDYDDHLTDEGNRQVIDLVEKLRSKNIQIIFHSPLIRAQETASIVSENLSLPIRVVENLRERNSYGVLTGLVKSEAKEKFPHEVEKFEKDKLNHNVKDSESYGDFKQRVINVFDNLLKNNEYDVIAIVSHGGVISTFVRDYIAIGETKIGDCGFFEFEINNEGEIVLLSENDATIS